MIVVQYRPANQAVVFYENGAPFYQVADPEDAWAMIARMALSHAIVGHLVINNRKVTDLPALLRELTKLVSGEI